MSGIDTERRGERGGYGHDVKYERIFKKSGIDVEENES